MSIIVTDARIQTIKRMGFGLSKLASILKKDITPDSKSESILGIDIGSSAIKFVQISGAKDVPTLETYGELQLGPYEDTDIGRTVNLPTQKLAAALSDILREAGATTKKAVYALSYGSSFTSTILIPTLNQEEIDSMLSVEARKYIPVSLSKVTLDWLPLGSDKERKVTNVLLSAVYNDAQEQYERIMQSCNLKILTREVEIFSTIRSTVSPDDEVVAVLDCGASATRLYIVEKGVITKTHSVPLSGVELTHELSIALGSTFRDAEEIKREKGILASSDEPNTQRILAKILESGIRELNTVIKRYSEKGGATVDKVILSGGGALLEGFSPYVAEAFSVPTVMADPFAKVAYPAFLEDTLMASGATFAVALGAALRGFQSEK